MRITFAAFLPSLVVSSYLAAFQGAFLAFLAYQVSYLVAFLAYLAFPVVSSSTAATSTSVSTSSAATASVAAASGQPEPTSLGLVEPYLEQPSLERLEPFVVAYLALVGASLAVALACRHPCASCLPFAVATPSSCVGFSASSSIAVTEFTTYVPFDDHLPSFFANASSCDVVLG